ncbi:MAG: extracellular solute-binding protein [Ilumatobacter sp.]|nr:extracellular solute-binding protein [Ilumatobacter sp.]
MTTPHPRARARRLLAATIGTLALLAAACGSDEPAGDSGPSATGGSGATSVTLYSGRTEDLVQPILDQFRAATGISVEVKYGDSADLALLIEEEAAADNVRADVFLSQSPGSLGFLEQNGRLAELPQSTLDLVPAAVRDDGGKWVGFSGRQRVVVYNSDLLSPADLPASVFDLTDPAWKGRIGVAPSNGSFQDFVTAMRVTEGDDATLAFLEGLDANDPVLYPKNSAIVAAVGRGEVEIGLVNHYYNFRALEEDPSLPSANHQFAPDDPGSTLIITGAAIVDGTDRADVAAQLIDFLLSPTGQRYFAEETFEYPLAIGQSPATAIPPIDFGAVGDVGGIAFEDLAGGLEATRALIATSGLES